MMHCVWQIATMLLKSCARSIQPAHRCDSIRLFRFEDIFLTRCGSAFENTQSLYFIDGSECSAGYPLCVCEYACGPFIEVAKGYTPLLNYITSSGVASAFYSLVLGSNFVPWTLLFMSLLAIFFLRNSLTVYIVRMPPELHGLSHTPLIKLVCFFDSFFR